MPTTDPLPPSSVAVRDADYIDHTIGTIRNGGPAAVAAALSLVDYCRGWVPHPDTFDRLPAVRQRLRDTGVLTPGGAIR